MNTPLIEPQSPAFNPLTLNIGQWNTSYKEIKKGPDGIKIIGINLGWD